MSVRRLDNTGIVVRDLDAAVGFFVELGLRLDGRTTVQGEWVDAVTGVPGTVSRIAVLEAPGGGRIELSTFDEPGTVGGEGWDGGAPAPANAVGIRRIMLAVDDLRDTLDRLRPLGAEPVGEVVRYGDAYLLCTLRGPEGILIALAEELG